MAYPHATADDVAFFAEHGWIVVDRRRRSCRPLGPRGPVQHDPREEGDPRLRLGVGEGTDRDQRDFRILQSSPTIFFPELNEARFRSWAIEFASALLGRQVEFWYDQFLAKPPGVSVPTAVAPGRGLLGPQPRRAGHHLLDAAARRRRAQRVHALHRRGPPRRRPRAPPAAGRAERPPLLRARRVPHGRLPDPARQRHLPPRQDAAHDAGEPDRLVAAHPHPAPPGRGRPGEGDHYPWKVYVNQFTGERTRPAVR